PDDEGEVSHFKALTSALSATVGLGNIAGVAAAIAMGGPGAVLWMWMVAFFGMSMKFSSCSLSQMFRRVKDDGSILGGPMVYLDDGIKSLYPNLAWLGKTLAVLFCIFCVCGAFGGGNLFQANQTYILIATQCYGDPAAAAAWLPWTVGIVLAITAGLVLIGGIKRIGSVTSKMVPLMCGTYTLICLIIIICNISAVPSIIAEIFIQAFSPAALIAGGFLGVFVTGMKRAAFSNEAGLGSAAIAHAAAKTKEPVREGVVAMLGPFIDTILVCTMTAITILATDAHLGQGNGIELTHRAFSYLGNWATWALLIIVVIFAYSTIISWSYYAERVLEYLFGQAAILPYRILYVIAIVFGPLFTLGNVLDFSDLMLLSMAFPNIIGMILLSPLLAKKLKDYRSRLESGAMKPYVAEDN
ncbi:MAG: alanine:cation symporter family protein, partial [Planctomycetes bacterium]|nr:alanine:cation symporter family protein [Planctomycetota bacterium]